VACAELERGTRTTYCRKKVTEKLLVQLDLKDGTSSISIYQKSGISAVVLVPVQVGWSMGVLIAVKEVRRMHLGQKCFCNT